jgi:hypothetical protein
MMLVSPFLMIVVIGIATYRDLKDEPLAIVFGLEGIKNGRKLVGIKFDCYNSSASISYRV